MKLFSKVTFADRISKLLTRCAIKPELKRDGAVAILVTLERSYVVEIEEWGRFVRLTGHPTIGFPPDRLPERLLANLLLRNSEAGNGGWRLIAADDLVWICYSYCIPSKQLNRSNLIDGLQLVLGEVNRFALEYRYFKRT